MAHTAKDGLAFCEHEPVDVVLLDQQLPDAEGYHPYHIEPAIAIQAVAYGGFQSVDLVWGDREHPGLHLHVTDHRFHEGLCACGHHTRARPGEGAVDPLFEQVALSEWRLVGPRLATLIVALHLRFRLSRARTREFLQDWLGLSLSVGTLDRTLHEAAAALAPLEEELIEAVLASDLLHADETSWPQGADLLWLWVFTSATVTFFVVASGPRGAR